MKTFRPAGCSLLFIGVLCFSGPAFESQQTATPPARPPFVFNPATTMIYVNNFELDAEIFQADEGRTGLSFRSIAFSRARVMLALTCRAFRTLLS